MLFSSITFLYYFLPAVLVIYYLAPAKVKNLILFLASFVFYLWGEPKYSVLLLFSVTAGYMGGRCIEYQRQKKCVCAADPADRSGKYKGGHDRLVVGIFTAMTLGLLVFFKYMDYKKILGSFYDGFKTVIFKCASCTFGIYLLHFFFILWIPYKYQIDCRKISWRIGGALVIFTSCLFFTYICKKIPIIKYLVP